MAQFSDLPFEIRCDIFGQLFNSLQPKLRYRPDVRRSSSKVSAQPLSDDKYVAISLLFTSKQWNSESRPLLFRAAVVELSRLSHITDSKLLQSFQHTCLPCVRSVRLRLRDVRRVADVNDLIDRMISLRALELDLGRLEQALNELGPGHVERNAPIPTRTGISELQRRHFASGKDWNGRHPNKSKLAGAVDKWKKRDRKFTLATVFRFICWCTHWEDRHLTTVPREWVSEKKPKLISLSWLICLDGED